MKNELETYRDPIWGSMRDLLSFQRGMNRIIEDVFGPVPQKSVSSYTPACDVEEKEGHYLMTIDLPGVSKEDVKIEINKNQLSISGQRKEERKEEKNGHHYVERYQGNFVRSFTLPTSVDAEKIEATYQNGVLSIALPKSEAVKPKRIQVTDEKTGFLGKFLGRKEDAKVQESVPVKSRVA